MRQAKFLVAALLLFPLAAVAQEQQEPPYELVLQWGSEGTGDGQFQGPTGIGVDSAGNVYVADSGNSRIQKFTGEGQFLAKWGDDEGKAQLSSPLGLAVDDEGHVYVADSGHERIVKFDSDGAVVTIWGSYGTGGGQFDVPMGVAMSFFDDSVYVTDPYNNRIQLFMDDGEFMREWETSEVAGGERSQFVAVGAFGDVYVTLNVGSSIQKFVQDGELFAEWEFQGAECIAADAVGNIFVVDRANCEIHKFRSVGTFLTKWGSSGTGDGQFQYPYGIAVDASGNVYVADHDSNRIQKFAPPGGQPPPGGEPPPEFVLKWGSLGTGDGQFNHPVSLALDSSGNVYVADWSNCRISKFDSDGNFLTKWGSQGSGDGEFDIPEGVAVDASNNVYVADSRNHRIQKFTSDGAFLAKWGSYGTGDGQFSGAEDLAVDGAGNVYVADTHNHRIQKFDSDGTFLAKWDTYRMGTWGKGASIAVDAEGNLFLSRGPQPYSAEKFDADGNLLFQWGPAGTGDGQFYAANGLGVNAYGNVYVVDSYSHRIQKFTSDGRFLTKWGSEGSGDGQFTLPYDVAADADGNIYVADATSHQIQKFYLAPPDLDGDGLRDDWETYGYTHKNGEFVDLPAMGADPERKDVFVQIDYMAGRQPMNSALQKVVAAFANAPVTNPDGSTGITLHIHLDEQLELLEELGTLGEGGVYVWTRPDGSPVTHFDDLKAVHFAEELGSAVHYCIWANKIPGQNAGMSRGIEAGDFIVSLGDWIEQAGQSEESWEAGTFMHELGHNLGLGHGGGDDVNFKPNYLSIMNYAFQMDGLMYGGELEHFDYSRTGLDPLDEYALDESQGLTPAGDVAGYGTTWWWFMLWDGNPQNVQHWAEDAAAPINWRVVEYGPEGDINQDSAYGTLTSFDDWSNLVFTGGSVGAGIPAPPPAATPAEELDLPTALTLMTPAPVTKLNGHTADGNLLHLTWKPAGPQKKIREYRIYRDGTKIGTSATTEFKDQNVEAGVSYSYFVTWVNLLSQESVPSEEVVLELR